MPTGNIAAVKKYIDVLSLFSHNLTNLLFCFLLFRRPRISKIHFKETDFTLKVRGKDVSILHRVVCMAMDELIGVLWYLWVKQKHIQGASWMLKPPPHKEILQNQAILALWDNFSH